MTNTFRRRVLAALAVALPGAALATALIVPAHSAGTGQAGSQWSGVPSDGIKWAGALPDGSQWSGVSSDGIKWAGVAPDGSQWS